MPVRDQVRGSFLVHGSALCSLIKGRIALLVAATTALGYWTATGSAAIDAVLIVAVVGTALLSAGAGVLNNVLEREVDARMARTRGRALPQGTVQPPAATWFGVSLTAAGTALLLWRGGWLPALIGLLAAVLYLFVYTPLKRYSWLNTTLGAIPGALPPLIGWTAANPSGGGLGHGAWILFAILFLWQHPHFYAIAWALRDEYRAAGLRMAGAVGTSGNFLAVQVILFLLVLIPVSLLLTAVGVAGRWYAAGCVLAGLLYLAAGMRFARRRDRSSSRLLLRASVLYLPAVLAFLVADLILGPA